MGEIGKSEQFCALGAQPHHLGDDRLVVGRAAIVAAHGEGAEDLFAQVAALGELQERLDAGARQRDHVAVELALLRFGFHRLAHEVGQAGELGFAVDGEREGLLVGEHVLAERGAQGGKALGDFGKPLLRGVVEAGAGAAEAGVVALQHALLLGIEAERVDAAHQRIDAAEQRRVGVDLVPMPRHLRRNLALDLEQRVVGMGAGQEMEHVADPRQRPSGELQRRDGIVEARRRRIGRNGRDLGLVVGERAGIGRPEMLGLDAVERRRLVGGGPIRQERIVGGAMLAGAAGLVIGYPYSLARRA